MIDLNDKRTRDLFINRCPHSHDNLKLSNDFALYRDPDEVCIVKSEFEADADINEIARRFGLTGVIPNEVNGQFADFSDIPDSLLDAYQLAVDAQKSWSDLPDHVKQHFDNPQSFVGFIESPDFNPSDLVNIFKEPVSDQKNEQVPPSTHPQDSPSPAQNQPANGDAK